MLWNVWACACTVRHPCIEHRNLVIWQLNELVEGAPGARDDTTDGTGIRLRHHGTICVVGHCTDTVGRYAIVDTELIVIPGMHGVDIWGPSATGDIPGVQKNLVGLLVE